MPPRVFPVRRLVGCLSLISFVALALACASGTRPSKSVGTVKVNEELVFADSKWVVTEVKDLGKTLKPTNADGEIKNADGLFLLVRYKVSNTGRSVVFLGDDPELVDDKDRKFTTISDQKEHLPAGARTMEDEDQIPAGITREFLAVYELPTDAKGLRLRAESFAERKRRQQEGFIDLGR